MSSIAQTCQYMTLSDNDLVRDLWVADQHIDRSHEDVFPLWLGEIFSRGYPNNTTRDELMGIVETYAGIKCTLPESHDLITCVEK